nr:hypothetical protein [Tanacetum cinerariifolium]
MTGCFGDVKKFLNNEKLEIVVVIIKSCTLNALGNLSIRLKDLYDTIFDTIHYKVLTRERFAKAITVGASLILHNVYIFSRKQSTHHYLNITKKNMVKTLAYHYNDFFSQRIQFKEFFDLNEVNASDVPNISLQESFNNGTIWEPEYYRCILLRYLEELDKLIDKRVLKYKELQMKGTTLEACLVTEGAVMEAGLVTEGATLEASLVNEEQLDESSSSETTFSKSKNKNRSPDKESSISEENDVYANIEPSYDSDTETKVPHSNNYTFENVFAHGIQIHEQPESIPDTYETGQTLRMLLPKKDNVNTRKQGLGFEIQNDDVNPSLLNNAKELEPYLYNIDEMGKDSLSDPKIISEEELKCEAEKCLKVK